jgi:imidazolonepropionase-like amidohydrolase
MDWILTCDRYFDGNAFVERPTRVEIDDGRIAQVRPRAEAATNGHADASSPATNGSTPPEAAGDASVRHAHAPTLLPGLIDAHAHVLGYTQRPSAGNPFSLDENHLRLLICNGVTTARDAGNSIERIEYLHWWTEHNDGPDVVPTSPVLSVPPFDWSFTRITGTPRAARQTVRRLDGEDVSTVALHHHLSPEVVEAAVDEAHRRGLRVSADVDGLPAGWLLDAGVDCIERVKNVLAPGPSGLHTDTPAPDAPDSIAEEMRRWSRIDLDAGADADRIADLVDRLAESDVAVGTGLLSTERWCSVEAMVEEPHLEYMTTVMPAAEKMLEMRQPMGMMMGKQPFREHLNIPKLSSEAEAEVEEGLATLRRFTARLAEAGVRVVAGTDTPKPSIVPGFSAHQEVELLVRCGLSPADALQTATSEPAALLRNRRDDETRAEAEDGGTAPRGAVREGHRADLLLVDGDPSADITATRNVQAVFKRGSKVDRQDLFAPIQANVDAL